ncbi:mitochondrial carrier, partial [Backusella circina FSU 941]
NFAAAAGGLSLSTSCMYPLDTIKTKMQVEPSLTWRRLLFSKEIVRTLRRGMLVSSVAAAGQGGLRFAVYESIKSRLANKKKSSISFLEIAGCAATGDISSSIIKVPREVITTKLQTNHYKSNRSAEAPGFSYVVKKILAEEGIRELFKGYWTIAARDIPFMVLLLGTYEELKSFHQRAQSSLLNAPPLKQYSFQRGETVTGSPIEPSKITLPTSIGILYGGISGFTAAYITTPFDVIRTRLITPFIYLLIYKSSFKIPARMNLLS